MVDAATNTPKPSIRVGPDPVAIAVGFGYVWVTDQTAKALYRIDPGTRQVKEIRVGSPVTGIAVDEDLGRLWMEVVPKG